MHPSARGPRAAVHTLSRVGVGIYAFSAASFSCIVLVRAIAMSCGCYSRFAAAHRSCRLETQWIQVISPRLHHLAAFFEPLSAIVSCPHLVSLGVCQLKLYEVGVPALLVQTRGRHATKPVRHHFVSRVAQAPQSSIERVVADGTILRTQRRKQKARTSCEGRQILKDPKRLIRKRHKVRLASLHTCGRNTPKCVRKIHCSPFGVSQFAWANEYVGRKLQSKCHGRPAHRCVGAPRAAPEL